MLNVPLTRQRANLKVRGRTDRDYYITLISSTGASLGRVESSCAKQHTEHSMKKQLIEYHIYLEQAFVANVSWRAAVRQNTAENGALWHSTAAWHNSALSVLSICVATRPVQANKAKTASAQIRARIARQ